MTNVLPLLTRGDAKVALQCIRLRDYLERDAVRAIRR